MNLYQINSQLNRILIDHMDEYGVLTDEGAKLIEELNISKDEVIDELAKEVKNYQGHIDAIEGELERLQTRKKQYEKTQQSLVNLIGKHVTVGEKRVRPEYQFQWTTSSPLKGLEDYDAELIYNTDGGLKKFVKVVESKPVYSFDKNAIKEALKANDDDVPVTVYIDKIKNLKIK